MKKQYTQPKTANVLLPEPLMELKMAVSEKFTSKEASRESKFGEDEHDIEDHENFWDE